MIPGVAREQVEDSGPAGGDLQADSGRSYAGSCHLRRPEAEEGMIYNKDRHKHDMLYPQRFNHG